MEVCFPLSSRSHEITSGFIYEFTKSATETHKMLELFMETKEQAQVLALENIWYKHISTMQCSKLL